MSVAMNFGREKDMGGAESKLLERSYTRNASGQTVDIYWLDQFLKLGYARELMIHELRRHGTV